MTEKRSKETQQVDSCCISFVIRDFLSNFAPEIKYRIELWHYNAAS